MSIWFYVSVGLFTIIIYGISLLIMFQIAYSSAPKGFLDVLLSIIEWVFLPITILIFLLLTLIDGYKKKKTKRKSELL